MLKLSDRSPVAQGQKRACYSHPDNPDRMIKVLLPHAAPEVIRRNSKSLRRRHLPAWYLDEQRRELKAFKRLHARLGERAWQHVPKFHGTVDTDLGMGLVSDFVRSADGSAGVNLTRYFPTRYSESVQNAVEALKDWIVKVQLVPRDFGIYNVVICGTSEGSHHAWLVDGFGSAEFIPFSEWSARHGRRLAQRRIDRFNRKISDMLEQPVDTIRRYPITLDQ